MTDKEIKAYLKQLRKDIPDDKHFKKTLIKLGAKKERINEIVSDIDKL